MTAGLPIVAEEQAAPPRLHDFESFAGQFDSRPDLSLRVTGDSLDKVGFQTGDIVAVRRTPETADGDLVVARIGQDVALKRYCRKANIIELQPESTNPEHEAVRIEPEDDFQIVGVGAIVDAKRSR